MNQVEMITRPVCRACGNFSVPVFGFTRPCGCASTPAEARELVAPQPVPRADVARMMFAAYRCESPIVLARLRGELAQPENAQLMREGEAQSGGNARR